MITITSRQAQYEEIKDSRTSILKVLTLIVLAALLNPLSAQRSFGEALQPESFDHFESRHCINLHVSSKWRVFQDTADVLLFIYPPQARTASGFVTYYNIRKKNIYTGNPQADFKKFMEDARATLNSTIENLNLKGVKLERLNHYDSYAWKFSGQLSGVDLIGKQNFVYVGGDAYVFTYMADPLYHSKFRDEMNDLTRSFYLDIQDQDFK